MKNYAIIVAGGSGSRMKAEVPKQFLLLNGKPVLMHTIEAFHRSAVRPDIILSLNSDFISYWKELCLHYQFNIPHKIIEGGRQRFDSVKNALNLVQESSIIAVHDGVRPITSNNLISRCFSIAAEKGTAIPVINSRDSLRKKEGQFTTALKREDILIVQTPQVFKSELLIEAYKQAFSEVFTDDASVVEQAGHIITVTEGDPRNIKITWPEDLEVAALLQNKT